MTDEAVCITCGDVAVAMRVVKVGEDGLAECVAEHGTASTVEISLLDAVVPGDEVLVHAGVALERLEAV